jgi:hypothetical protein
MYSDPCPRRSILVPHARFAYCLDTGETAGKREEKKAGEDKKVATEIKVEEVDYMAVNRGDRVDLMDTEEVREEEAVDSYREYTEGETEEEEATF